MCLGTDKSLFCEEVRDLLTELGLPMPRDIQIFRRLPSGRAHRQVLRVLAFEGSCFSVSSQGRVSNGLIL